ncbi:MAG: 30S ribosome-binding factor RbfA [Anaerolineales bacterium]|nr:30S ribosome-binding factor RbfA [Anaerolineales bacterium]
MSTRRQKQISVLIQKELGDLLEKKVSDPRLDFMTITAVKVSPDLRQAHIYVSTLGDQQEAMEGFDHAASFLRRELASRLALRYVPELIFHLDTSLQHGERIFQLLEEIEETQEEPVLNVSDG